MCMLNSQSPPYTYEIILMHYDGSIEIMYWTGPWISEARLWNQLMAWQSAEATGANPFCLISVERQHDTV